MATFEAMIRYLGISILLVLASFVCAQTSGNPFDLKYRSSKPASATPNSTAPLGIDSVGVPSGAPGDVPKSDQPSQAPQMVPANIGEQNAVTKGFEANPFELNGQKGSRPQDTLATAHVLKKDQLKEILPPVLKQRSSRGFQIFFLLLSLLFLIFIVNVERSFVRDLWKVIANENYSSLHLRNQRSTMRQILLMMGYTVFILQAGLFLYHALHVFKYKGDLLDNIWATMTLVLGIYLVRHGVIRYLRWLFNNDKEMTLYGFDISIFNTMVGLILLPINLLLIFGPESMFKTLIIIGIISAGVAYLSRQLRWMLSARQLISHSLFLFFVYLCAVEILPVWMILTLFW